MASAYGELRHDRSGRVARFERHYATDVEDL